MVQDAAVSANQLLERCQELQTKRSAGSLGDSDAQQLFCDYPIQTLNNILSSGVLGGHGLELVVSIITSCLSLPGSKGSLLPAALPHLHPACASPVAALRKMAVDLIGLGLLHLFEQGGPSPHTLQPPGSSQAGMQPAQQQQLVLAEQLVLMLQDADLNVADAASTLTLGWALGSPWCMQQLLLPASPLGARLHALILELAGVGSRDAAGCQQGLKPPLATPPRCATPAEVSPRALALGLKACCARPEGPAMMEQAGLLQPVVVALGKASSDPLGTLGLLAVLRESLESCVKDAQPGLAQQELRQQDPTAGAASAPASTQGGVLRPDQAAVHGLAAVMHRTLVTLLVPLMSDPLLSPSVLTLCAVLLRGTLEAHGQEHHNTQQAGSLSPSAVAASAPCSSSFQPVSMSDHPLLAAIHNALDPGGPGSVEAEIAAIDAAGVLGLTVRGGEALLLEAPGSNAVLRPCFSGTGSVVLSSNGVSTYGRVIAHVLMARALASNCPTPALRLAALHAAANIAGLERVHETGDRRAALLSPIAETLLGDAAYMACTSASTPSPAEALLSLLEPPFPEQRAAVYRFIAAMALRSWFAAEVVRHSGLLAQLTSPGAESKGVSVPVDGSYSNTTWRYAAVESLWLTAEAIQQPRAAHGPAPPLTDLPPPAAVAPGTAELTAARAALTAALPVLRQGAQGGPHGARRAGVEQSAGVGAPRAHQVATL